MKKLNIASTKFYVLNDLNQGLQYGVMDSSNTGRNEDQYLQVILKDKKIVLKIGSHPYKTGMPALSKMKTIEEIREYLKDYTFLDDGFKKIMAK